jgi:hypothetical protein
MPVGSENIMATEPTESTERLELLTNIGHGHSPNYPAEVFGEWFAKKIFPCFPWLRGQSSTSWHMNHRLSRCATPGGLRKNANRPCFSCIPAFAGMTSSGIVAESGDPAPAG